MQKPLGFAATLVAAMTIAGSALSADRCDLPGVGRLAGSDSVKFILVGEVHGSEQTPDVFGDLVCSLARRGRRVAVGLELFQSDQPWIDRFMASDGGATARAEFLGQPAWSSGMRSGQTSRAMFALIERLRLLKKNGAVVDVTAALDRPDAAGHDSYEDLLASGLRDLAARHTDATVVALMGNVHATKHPVSFGGPAYQPAAMLLPPAQTISLWAENRSGEAWNCHSAVECGPHSYAGDDTGRRRGVHMIAGMEGYDGAIDSGLPATASPPASPHA